MRLLGWVVGGLVLLLTGCAAGESPRPADCPPVQDWQVDGTGRLEPACARESFLKAVGVDQARRLGYTLAEAQQALGVAVAYRPLATLPWLAEVPADARPTLPVGFDREDLRWWVLDGAGRPARNVGPWGCVQESGRIACLAWSVAAPGVTFYTVAGRGFRLAAGVAEETWTLWLALADGTWRLAGAYTRPLAPERVAARRQALGETARAFRGDLPQRSLAPRPLPAGDWSDDVRALVALLRR